MQGVQMGSDSASGRTSKPGDIEFLVLVARGYTNKALAASYGVSVTAIKKRLSRLMLRFGVATRTELVTAGFEAGLIGSGEHGAGSPRGR